MSSNVHNNLTYSENNWVDVIGRYNLHNYMEVIIRKESPIPDSTASNPNKHSSLWLIRSVALVSLIAAVGNLPVQSHLLASDNSNMVAFEIKSKEMLEDDPTTALQTLASEISEESTNLDEDTILNSKELELPARALETYAGSAITAIKGKWTTYQVKSYDNLTNIFHKLEHQDILKTLKADETIYKELKKLKKGSIVRASSLEGELSELVLTHDNKNSYVVTFKNDQYEGNWKKNIFEVRQARASFTIENGLFFDGRKAGISNKVIKQFVKVFDWDIDFSHDVRVGDKVTTIFEEIYHDGDKVGNQHLLAAEFINKGRDYRVIRYTNKNNKADYFTPQGREMKKAFIRTPIAHARISSHFNPGRFHPVLHKIRAHKGTDFAARRGTPIMATGNGVIKSLGRKGGYGRTIIIKHRGGITTTYAHMSRYKKGLKAGSKVSQGDTIGYVGSSGLATGSHLHYEFHQNRKAVNAMTVSLPNTMSLSRKELQDFRNKAINLVLQLNVLHRFVEADIEIDSVIGG